MDFGIDLGWPRNARPCSFRRRRPSCGARQKLEAPWSLQTDAARQQHARGVRQQLCLASDHNPAAAVLFIADKHAVDRAADSSDCPICDVLRDGEKMGSIAWSIPAFV